MKFLALQQINSEHHDGTKKYESIGLGYIFGIHCTMYLYVGTEFPMVLGNPTIFAHLFGAGFGCDVIRVRISA